LDRFAANYKQEVIANTSIFTIALVLSILFNVPSSVVRATPNLQDATATPVPEEEAAPATPTLATAAAEIELTNQFGRAIVNFRDDYLIVDSVPPLGGPNLEINPLDLLLGAQGACGVLIMERVAVDQNIPLAGVKGKLAVEFNPRGLRDGAVSPAVQMMHIEWEIGTETHEEAQMLVGEWLARCPVYNTLVRATEIEATHKLMGEGTALLNIAFTYDGPTEAFQNTIAPLAAELEPVEGLLSQTWALDETNSRSSGMLLFMDGTTMQLFLESELAAAMMANPTLGDIEVTPYTSHPIRHTLYVTPYTSHPIRSRPQQRG